METSSHPISYYPKSFHDHCNTDDPFILSCPDINTPTRLKSPLLNLQPYINPCLSRMPACLPLGLNVILVSISLTNSNISLQIISPSPSYVVHLVCGPFVLCGYSTQHWHFCPSTNQSNKLLGHSPIVLVSLLLLQIFKVEWFSTKIHSRQIILQTTSSLLPLSSSRYRAR